MMLMVIVLFEVILLELILALSNVWFTTFLGEQLPYYYKEKAQFLGLFFAWTIRFVVLIFYTPIVDSHVTFSFIPQIKFYWIDMIMLISGTCILFKTGNVLFSNRSYQRAHSISLNIVLLQGTFVSTVLAVDAVRTATFYVDNMWIVSLVVLVSMLISSWLSPKLINRRSVETKGLLLLLASTGLLLTLEAFHLPILSELICFGIVLYLMNTFLIWMYGRMPEKTKMLNQ